MALEETMPENQKSLSLLLSRWLHCRAWRTAESSKDNSATKHSMSVYNLGSQVSIGSPAFSTTEAALILLLHALISRVVILSVEHVNKGMAPS